MKKPNWKNIKKIVGEFQDVQDLQGSEESFHPLFVHANRKPIPAHPKMLAITPNFGSADFFFYYLIYLAETKRNNLFSNFLVKVFVCDSTAEEINLIEEKSFESHQRDELIALVSVPNKMFCLENQDIEVITYKNKKIRQLDFENEIELWRKTFQIKS